jgi:hypothetical protein
VRFRAASLNHRWDWSGTGLCHARSGWDGEHYMALRRTRSFGSMKRKQFLKRNSTNCGCQFECAAITVTSGETHHLVLAKMPQSESLSVRRQDSMLAITKQMW